MIKWCTIKWLKSKFYFPTNNINNSKNSRSLGGANIPPHDI